MRDILFFKCHLREKTPQKIIFNYFSNRGKLIKVFNIYKPFNQLVQDVQCSSLELILFETLATLDKILNALLAANDDDKVSGKSATRVNHDPLDMLEDIRESMGRTISRATIYAKPESASLHISGGVADLKDQECVESSDGKSSACSDFVKLQNNDRKQGNQSCNQSDHLKQRNPGNLNVIDNLFEALL